MDQGTAVAIVGEISSQPRDFLFFQEKKMQVAVGPDKTDHTLHLGDAELYAKSGKRIDIDDLQDKWWIRAAGTIMGDPRRIHVTRLDVLGKDWETYRQSTYWSEGQERGYILAVAGMRYIFPDIRTLPTTRVFKPGTHVTVLAPISSQPRDAELVVEKKMQVAIGPDRTDYTLHLNRATMLGLDRQEIAVSGLQDRMWVQAEGKVMEDSRRIQVERLRVVAPDDATFRGGPDYRPEAEHGYIIAR